MTRGAASVGTLKFVADENGVGVVGVGGELKIDANDKLEVDISNYNRANGLKLVLVTYGSKSGSFTAGNITVTGHRGGTVAQADSNRIVLNAYPPGGTVITFR